MKLFKVLQSLNIRQQRNFQAFLTDQSFNRRKDVVALYQLMLESSRTQIRPKDMWKSINPQHPFSKSQWHLLTSRLFKLLENYLAIEQFHKNESDKSFYLIRAYRDLGLYPFIEKTIDAYRKSLDKQPLRDVDYLRNIQQLEHDKYHHISGGNRKGSPNLQVVSDRTDIYFMATKLRQACHALSRSIIQQEQYTLHFVADMLRLIQQEPSFLNVPAIAIYYNCYRLLKEEDNEEYFKQLRKNIVEFQSLFTPPEMRDIYTIAINYAIRRLNTGAEHYIREAFELYSLSLRQGFLIENSVMQDTTYTNMVFLASKLEKFAWAKQFVIQYKNNLQPISRQSLYHYSLGKIYYEQGLLDQSLKELVVVDSKQSFILLGARILQLKIYFELGETDPLESLLESLRVYLQRSKNLAYRKAHYINILSFTKQLLQLPTMTPQEKTALKERIQAAEVLGEKSWLLKAVRN